jgi:ribosome maturation factor RimP
MEAFPMARLEQVVSRLKEVLLPALNSFGVEMVDLRYRLENRGWVLRLFIDKEGGITLEDCQRVSEQVGDLLDVEDLIGHGYRLEVSSPGLDRPLTREGDFVRFTGKRARISSREPISNQRNFQGKILGVQDHQVLIEEDKGVKIAIPFPAILKARLIPEFPGQKG